MAKIPATICEHCKQVDCDGVIYKIKEPWGEPDGYYRKWRGCKNDTRVKYKDGKPYFHWVMGHGIESWCELEHDEN